MKIKPKEGKTGEKIGTETDETFSSNKLYM